MTTALEGGEWSAARPLRTLPPGKTRYPFYRSLGGPQGRSGRAENFVPTWIRSRTVQPVVRRYIDRDTRPTNIPAYILIKLPQSWPLDWRWKHKVPPNCRDQPLETTWGQIRDDSNLFSDGHRIFNSNEIKIPHLYLI